MESKKFGSEIFLDPIFLHGSSSWVELRFQTKNQLPGCPGTGLKVCLVGGVGGWWTDQKPCHSSLNGVGLTWDQYIDGRVDSKLSNNCNLCTVSSVCTVFVLSSFIYR